ncbi:hypothetical protein V7S77_02075 [Aquirufa ecclesiirivi]|uniref:hypothetical protein n=1 Tax=Aquirufa ecclesiirivi TaxID=2715124 RepID=UPI00140B2E43|nr:hypothetical protein [Aquirufa ecclesiirivi]NHC49183.1 hypothetical protein [Aquirufa ecclesiirivi]
MKILRTFAISEKKLYSILFDEYLIQTDSDEEPVDEKSCHEFNRLFNFFTDANLLYEFFVKNEADLKEPFWEGISIEKAILKVRTEAIDLHKKIKKYSIDPEYTLASLFEPLSGTKNEEFGKTKASVNWKKPMIRIYAIKIRECYLICGGAIKLRKTINDRQYLIDELNKMKISQAWCKETFNLDDTDDIDFLVLK